MAQRLPKSLVPGSLLTTSAAIYYTVPSGALTTVSAMTLCNTSAGVVGVTVYLVPNAGSPGAASTILSARKMAAGESYNVSGAIGQTIAAGATIRALDDTGAAVSLVASGYETTI